MGSPLMPPVPPAAPQMAAPQPMQAPTPPPPSPETPQQNLPMEAKECREWWTRVDRDRATNKREGQYWDQLFRSYMPPTTTDGPININSNIHFRDVHLKTAEIWAQLPELILEPLEPLQDLDAAAAMPPPMPGQPPQQPPPASPDQVSEIVAIKRAVLNKTLGRDGANADLMMEQSLFDIFGTSGVAGTKICYQSDIQEIPQDMPTPPQPMPGSVLGLQDTPGGTAPQMVPVVVNERYLWYRFSPKKLLIPSDFHSTDFDSAPYLGMEFAEPLTPQNLKKYGLPSDFQPSESRDKRIVGGDQKSTQDVGSKKLITGVELWLYACYFDPTVAHTQVMRRLVLIDGASKDKPSIYVPSPFQTIDGKGRLTPDSMIGNPIHPIVLRVASDTAWIPSDSAFTDPLVRIENTWMTQDNQLRDANLPRFLHSDKITTAIDNLKNADSGQGVAINDALMTQGAARLIVQIPHLERAEADTIGRAANQQAIAETLGISSNQAGSYTRSTRSATEVATVQANVSVRLKKEQNNLLSRFLAGVTKFDALIQRYMTDPGYIQIVGQTGDAALKPFTNAHLSGRYAYNARPDSQLTIDIASERKMFTDFINFFAKSGSLNMKYATRQGAILFSQDPALMVQDPPPPPPPPPQPMAVSLALKAADLGIPEVRQVMAERGITLAPQTSSELQAEMIREAAKNAPKPPPLHGGAADKADLVDKHTSEHTGNQPGVPPQSGEPVPAMPIGRMVQ